MKTKQFPVIILVTALLSFCLFHPQAAAAISITNFKLTTNSVSFNISGTMPEVRSTTLQKVLFFENPNWFANPGFVVEYGMHASFRSFTDVPSLRSSTPVGTGYSRYGVFFVIFANNLTSGETVSGLFNATWRTTVFDPTVVGDLNVYAGGQSENGLGTFLTTTSTVPEPSSTFLAAVSSLALLRRTLKK